jgi:chorismate dehydratase
LLQCLLAELNLSPRLTGLSTAGISARRGRLLIGDQAIRFRQTHAQEFYFWDLGDQWNKLVDIPFVYALWLIRPEIRKFKALANSLRALRDENLAHFDQLIEAVVAGVGAPDRGSQVNPEFCARYYRENLRFNFGENEKEGLQAFQQLCEKYDLLPKREIEFKVV